MATTLSVSFLAGRYHATGWDHQVNEGTTEWPPSPWRILRALVSAAHRSLAEPETIAPILERLAASLPRYRVPVSTEHHTRHYMPTEKSTTKIFDTFRVFRGGGRDPAMLEITWPDLVLGVEERALLTTVLTAVGYLGRSQSWVEITLADDGKSLPVFNCEPMQGGEPPSLEATRVLATMAPSDYSRWRDDQDKKVVKILPTSLWEVLNQSTSALKKQKWTDPPGSRWTNYSIRPAPVERWPKVSSKSSTYQAVVLALQSRVLPPQEHSLRFGESVRRALMSLSDGRSVFSGKDRFGKPARGHRHAYFLPYDHDDDGFLDHVLVYAREGFDRTAMRAIESLTRLKGKNTGRHPISVHLESRWSVGARLDRSGAPLLLKEACVWRSRTPMLLPRHPKVTKAGRPKLDAQGQWIEGPIAQAHRALDDLGLPPREICVNETGGMQMAGSASHPAPWFSFDLERSGGEGSRYRQQAFCFTLTFAEPVSGPIALGYGSHFGLGLFAPG